MKNITYAVTSNGDIYSRVKDEIALPVLEYDKVGKNGNFNAPLTYHLEKYSIQVLTAEAFSSLKWTKKIPKTIKNKHRAFWGMKRI